MAETLRINNLDNVAVALSSLTTGYKCYGVTALEDIPQGHKIALCHIPKGGQIIKYGFPIGAALHDIKAGQWVHVHNVKTLLNELTDYSYNPVSINLPSAKTRTFMGYRRPDKKVGIRNEVWIIPTVGCVNSAAQQLARMASQQLSGKYENVDGIYSFPHPYGCSQTGDDQLNTQKILASLVNHPNAAAVLVLGLGCENNNIPVFKNILKDYENTRVMFLECQSVEDEYTAGLEMLEKLLSYADGFSREPVSMNELVIGMKCGGSDGLSGITSNPLVGVCSDRLISAGGTAILTEVPEMFGAENLLLNRCISAEVFDKARNMLSSFKQYFVNHNQVVYENPSPGNKNGGITTLEDKSLGCVQKGGTAPIYDVLEYGGTISSRGLNLLSGPGNDMVSCTALTAAGAHLILFTTGVGTPFGAPAPTIKISSNNRLYSKKPGWIDFNAGEIADGRPMEDAADELLNFIIEVASGRLTKAEQNGFREIAIFKDGVVL